MRPRLFLLALLLSTPALAQTATPEQRIANQLGSLMIQNASLASQVEQLNAQLAAANAKIKELTVPAANAPAPH